jgi:uncharacterized membrane protein YvlD (DUF360 family)
MRALTTKEMVVLYRATRGCLLVGGAVMLVGGLWYFVTPILFHLNNPLTALGLFPAYIGGMLIIVAAAMKEDWFTNARRYW